MAIASVGMPLLGPRQLDMRLFERALPKIICGAPQIAFGHARLSVDSGRANSTNCFAEMIVALRNSECRIRLLHGRGPV